METVHFGCILYCIPSQAHGEDGEDWLGYGTMLLNETQLHLFGISLLKHISYRIQYNYKVTTTECSLLIVIKLI